MRPRPGPAPPRPRGTGNGDLIEWDPARGTYRLDVTEGRDVGSWLWQVRSPFNVANWIREDRWSARDTEMMTRHWRKMGCP